MNNQTSALRPYRYLWPLTFTLIAISVCHPLTNFDFWWHMASARYILQSGRLPMVDVFNFTYENTPWFVPAWLFQTLFFLAFLWGNVNLLIFLKAIVIGAAYFLVYKCIDKEKRNSILALFFIISAYAGGRYRFIIRPHIFFYLYTVASVYLLNLIVLKRNFRLYLGLFILVVVAWNNSHGSIVFAYFLGGIYLSAAIIKYTLKQHSFFEVRKLFWVLLVIVLASLINPYSYRVLLYPLKIQAQTSQIGNLTEYRPPNATEYLGPLGIFLLALPVCLFPLVRQRKYSEILLLLFFAYAGVSYVRFSALFLMVAAPIYVNCLPRFPVKFENNILIAFSYTAFLALALLFLKPQLIDTKIKHIALGVNWDLYPQRAAQFIKENLKDMRGFNVYRWGGYLNWVLYPQQTFVDGRQLEDNTPFHESEKAFESKRYFNGLVNKYQLDFVLLDQLPPGISQYETEFFPSEEWRLVYWDKMSVIYLKNTPENQAIIKANPFFYLHPLQPSFAYLLKATDEKNMPDILHELDRSIALDPTNSRAYFLKATLAEKMADKFTAVTNYLMALKHNRYSSEAAYSLGRIFSRDLIDLSKAEKYLQLTLKLKPSHLRALNDLARLALEQNSYIKAEQYLLRMLEVAPFDFTAHYNLIRLYQHTNSPKIKSVYQWILDNPELVPSEKKQIIKEAEQALVFTSG